MLVNLPGLVVLDLNGCENLTGNMLFSAHHLYLFLFSHNFVNGNNTIEGDIVVLAQLQKLRIDKLDLQGCVKLTGKYNIFHSCVDFYSARTIPLH